LAASSACSSIRRLGQLETRSPECLDQMGMILLPEEKMIDGIVKIRAALQGLVGSPNELGLAPESARQDRDQRRRRGDLGVT
jgi:hypothetical protein